MNELLFSRAYEHMVFTAALTHLASASLLFVVSSPFGVALALLYASVRDDDSLAAQLIGTSATRESVTCARLLLEFGVCIAFLLYLASGNRMRRRGWAPLVYALTVARIIVILVYTLWLGAPAAPLLVAVPPLYHYFFLLFTALEYARVLERVRAKPNVLLDLVTVMLGVLAFASEYANVYAAFSAHDVPHVYPATLIWRFVRFLAIIVLVHAARPAPVAPLKSRSK